MIVGKKIACFGLLFVIWYIYVYINVLAIIFPSYMYNFIKFEHRLPREFPVLLKNGRNF